MNRAEDGASALPGAVRPGTAEDLDAVTALYRACARAGRERGNSTWNEEYPGAAEARADMQAGGLFVLEGDGGIIAAVTLLEHDDLDGLDCWGPGPACVLTRLCVAPQLQGHGLGRRMTERVCAAARSRGYAAARLLAARENRAACRIYEELGMRCAGETRMYGIDFLCYEARLGAEET